MGGASSPHPGPLLVFHIIIVEAIELERETLKFKYGYKLAHLKIKMLKKPGIYWSWHRFALYMYLWIATYIAIADCHTCSVEISCPGVPPVILVMTHVVNIASKLCSYFCFLATYE